MERFNDFLWMIQGFNVMYDGSIFTTTLFAKWICDWGVKDGKFVKVDKNWYKLKE